MTDFTLRRKVDGVLIRKTPMNTIWFKRIGWFYVPASVPGGIVSVLALLFCLTVFRAVDRHSHSASDTLYGVFPFFVCSFLLVDWIGAGPGIPRPDIARDSAAPGSAVTAPLPNQ